MDEWGRHSLCPNYLKGDIRIKNSKDIFFWQVSKAEFNRPTLFYSIWLGLGGILLCLRELTFRARLLILLIFGLVKAGAREIQHIDIPPPIW